MKLKWRGLQFEHYILGILLAVEWIMSFTFLGYIHIPPISITTAHIPIVVIACLFGPVESSVAGLFFGLGSMYKASALYVMLGDRIFSPFQTDFPIGSILLSVGTRVLFGFLMGCIFKIVNKSRYKWAGKSLAALIATPLHALLVYGAMGILFPESGFNYKSSFRWGVNDYAIAAICILAVILSDIIYHSSFVTHYKNVINDSESRQRWSVKMKISLFIIIIFVFCIAAFSTIYFASRTEYMFGVYGIKVTKKIAQDILHLQVQFLAAMISLNFILIVIILMIYNYMKHREYMGEMDALTNVMGRRLFLNYCTKCQNDRDDIDNKSKRKGWFLFIDIDWFKQINDTLGHTVGDETLKQIAESLKNIFSSYGAVGRVGGDEFAVIINEKMTKEQLEEQLKKFLLDISTILPERTVSCSIGVYHFGFPKSQKELLTRTDDALYKAKEKGRACYVILDE